MTQLTIQPNQIFNSLEGQFPSTEQQPGYFGHLDELVERNPMYAANRRFVRSLAGSALDGAQVTLHENDRFKSNPQLAGEWYRALGSMNDMTEAEHHLTIAAKLTFDPQAKDPVERETMRVHNVNMLMDLARITSNPKARTEAWLLASQNSRRLTAPDNPLMIDPTTRLEVYMLDGDLQHDLIRQKYTGSLEPHEFSGKPYWEYSDKFRTQELKTIKPVIEMLKDGKDVGSIGKLFELFYLIERRYSTWAEECIDTTIVRGATSREDEGEMVGVRQREIESDNFDVFINNRGHETRLQLTVQEDKGRKYNEKYIQELSISEMLGAAKKHPLTSQEIVERIRNRLETIRSKYETA